MTASSWVHGHSCVPGQHAERGPAPPVRPPCAHAMACDAVISTRDHPPPLPTSCRVQYRSRLARMQSSLTTDKQRQKELLKQAEDGLRRCLTMDATDPRTYVVLGKLLVMQKRYDEARKLYADGTSNTGAYHWLQPGVDACMRVHPGIGGVGAAAAGGRLRAWRCAAALLFSLPPSLPLLPPTPFLHCARQPKPLHLGGMGVSGEPHRQHIACTQAV